MKPPADLRSIAVENLTVGRMEPVRFVEEAAAAGFGRVGLPLATATPQPLEHEILGRPPVIRAIKDALHRTNTRVFDVEAFVLSPQADIGAYRRVLETGVELGATHISAIGAQLAAMPAFPDPQQRVDLFGRLCEEAARFGLHVGVECMVYRDIPRVADALALIETAGSANTGLILDVLHLHRAGTTMDELAKLPPSRIAYAQLCGVAAGSPAVADLPKEARTARLHPDQGVAPVRAFLDALPDGTPLAVETPVAAEVAWPTAQRLRSAAAHALAFFRAIG
jgi:sugar phosphate isomerase/epimerase